MISHANEASLHRMVTQESVMYHTITKLARTLFGTQTTRKTQPVDSRFRPRLECLEERAVPANMPIPVTLPGDANVQGTLRWAIETAKNQAGADVIEISPNLTVSLTSKLDPLAGPLTIKGGGAGSSVVQRSTAAGTPDFRIFEIAVGAVVTIENLRIRNGKILNEGGAIRNAGTLTLDNVRISESQVIGMGSKGGAVFNAPASMLNVTGSVIINNSAILGGGIANAGSMIITNSIIIGNRATQGGGIYTLQNSSSTLFTTDVEFNQAGSGGGILNGGSFAMSGGRIYQNSAVSGGGGLATTGDRPSGWISQTTLSNVQITKNSATAVNSKGGGVLLAHGNIDFLSCIVAENTAANGASMYYFGAHGTFTQDNTMFAPPPVNG